MRRWTILEEEGDLHKTLERMQDTWKWIIKLYWLVKQQKKKTWINSASTFMIYPYVKTALKNKIKMIIHYLQEMGKVTLKPGILWGEKKNRTWEWFTGCLWITANGFQQEMSDTQDFVFLWNLLLLFSFFSFSALYDKYNCNIFKMCNMMIWHTYTSSIDPPAISHLCSIDK